MIQKKIIRILLWFHLIPILACQSVTNTSEEIKAPDIFELAKTTQYKDLGYEEAINNFESKSSDKIYIRKCLKIDSGYLNKIVLVNTEIGYKTIKYLEWEELSSKKDCGPSLTAELINTKNIFTGEDLMICKKKDRELMTNFQSFQNKVNALDNLVRNAISMNLKNSKAKDYPNRDAIWDIFVVSKRGAFRYYRVDSIDGNIKKIAEDILTRKK